MPVELNKDNAKHCFSSSAHATYHCSQFQAMFLFVCVYTPCAVG